VRWELNSTKVLKTTSQILQDLAGTFATYSPCPEYYLQFGHIKTYKTSRMLGLNIRLQAARRPSRAAESSFWLNEYHDQSRPST
jgi:hypothetical protein